MSEEGEDKLVIPQTQWHQVSDLFTSIDEILRQQTELLAKIADKEVLIPPPEDVPVTIIDLLRETNRLLSGTEHILFETKKLTTSSEILMGEGQVSRSLSIKAKSTNSGTVSITKKGGGGVSTLLAGQSLSLDHDHSKEPLYVFSSSAGDEIEIIMIL